MPQPPNTRKFNSTGVRGLADIRPPCIPLSGVCISRTAPRLWALAIREQKATLSYVHFVVV